MSIDFKVPQSLMQYKGYTQVALTGETRFVFKFDNYNSKIHTLRVIQNSKLLSSDKYWVIASDKDVTVNLATRANVGDIIHLDIFMPLERYTEYSICTLDYIIKCKQSVNEYKLEFEYYDPISCKLQIFHSKIGFISKERYEFKNGNIIFNDIAFANDDILYVKVIQDGAILLQ